MGTKKWNKTCKMKAWFLKIILKHTITTKFHRCLFPPFFPETWSHVARDGFELSSIANELGLPILLPLSPKWDYGHILSCPGLFHAEDQTRVLYMLDRHSIKWATSPGLMSIFFKKSFFISRVNLWAISRLTASTKCGLFQLTGSTSCGMCATVQSWWGRWGPRYSPS